MKKFSVVLLILALVASFAFAEYVGEYVEEATSWSRVYPKDTVELTGSVGANFTFDFDKKDCGFDKSASVGFFDLSASKVIFEGAGSVKGEGAVYAAADASIKFEVKNTTKLCGIDDDGDLSFYDCDDEHKDNWKIEKQVAFEKLGTSIKLAINNFYIAKDGAWKLNLMKSDASLDYAQSVLSSQKALYKNKNYKNENVVKTYATFRENINAWKGVTFTAEADPYFGELAFGYQSNTEWNVLAKSKAVALEDLTVEGGFVIGTTKATDEDPKNHLEMGAGLNAAYADDYVALKAAADFGISGLNKEEDAKFDCDVFAEAKAFGATVDFYYATNATHYAPSDYALDGAAKTYNKYLEAKAAYAINYAGIDFEVGFVAKNLNWKTRTFGATFTAEHAIGTFGAEVDFTKDNGNDNGNKKELKGDFDVTFVADYFDAYADFEFARRSGEKFTWGLNVGVETDKIVDACTFGLDFNFTSKDWSKVDDISKARKITAFCEVAF